MRVFVLAVLALTGAYAVIVLGGKTRYDQELGSGSSRTVTAGAVATSSDLVADPASKRFVLLEFSRRAVVRRCFTQAPNDDRAFRRTIACLREGHVLTADEARELTRNPAFSSSSSGSAVVHYAKP